ncbi:hypothetical protein BGZ73_000171 [Actinomortierella ambigua]|nr:hypothetical protein BGZ73_000171 [Actinomortierella ambigua]
MGNRKKLSTVLCAASNKRHVYIAVYESDSASSTVLYLLRSNAAPKSLQQLTWETVTSRSMYYTHLIGRKQRPLLNACAVDDSGMFVLLSHDTAPKATSVRAPSAVYNNAQWDEWPRGLVYDPVWSGTWQNVDVARDFGCTTRLGCQTLIYARPPVPGSGTNQASFVAAHFSTNASDPSASPFMGFSVFDRSSRTFVRQTPDIEINLANYYSKQIGYHNGQLLLYYGDSWPYTIKTLSFNLDYRGLPATIHSDVTLSSFYGDNKGLPTTFDTRYAGSANDAFTFVHQEPEKTKSNIFTFTGNRMSKVASFDTTPSTPLLPFEYIVPVPAAPGDNGSLSPQWVIGFSGSQSYGVWMNGPRAGQWHRSDPTSIYILEPSEPLPKALVAATSLGYVTLLLGCALFCYRRRQRLKKTHPDFVYEFDRRQNCP